MGLLDIGAGLLNPVGAISTVAAIGDSYLGYKGAEKDREQQERQHQQNIALQREFAQMGIRWRVADAEAAGLHPLAALGASGAAYSPSYSMGGSEGGNRYRALQDMGQNFSRAINTMSTPEEKAHRALQVESLALDNALKKKQLEGLDSPGLPSNSSIPLHMLGQNPLNVYGSNGGYVAEMPTAKSHSSPGKPFQAAGEYTDYVFSRTPTGLHPVPSKEMQEAIEDKFVPETLWAARNYLYPTFSGKTRRLAKPSLREHPLPPGYDWQWKPSAAEWRPRRQKYKGWRSMFNPEN